MEKEFDEEEVAKALEECGGDKAPGPNEFKFSFIRAGWNFLKEDFCRMLYEFHRRGNKVNGEMNTTFLTLIPKEPNLVDLKNYRHMNLMGCITSFWQRYWLID